MSTIAIVQNLLTDDLRKPPWKGSEDRLAGYCYVASEALYYFFGGKEAGLVPMFIQHEGQPHWYLRSKHGFIDVTAEQFKTPVPWDQGIGKGFLTKNPSKRAKMLMKRLDNVQTWR